MMKRCFLYGIYLTVMLMAASCVDDRSSEIDKGLVVDENGEIEMEFSLQLPTPVRSVSTYSMSETAENKIKTLDVLVFKVDNNEEKFVYQTKATKIDDDPDDSHYKKVRVKLKVGDDTYRLVFLANVSEEIEHLGDIATTGEKDLVMARLLHESAATKKWNENNDDSFPMWGESSEVKITGSNTLTETIKMLRALARIDVIPLENKNMENFELTGAYLYQYHLTGHVVPDADHISNNKAHTPTIPDPTSIQYRSELYGASADGIIQQIYSYESERNTEHMEKTCIVVGGKYKTKENPDPDPTWYRIDLVDKQDKDIHLLRNYLYSINIKSVTGEGYTDPDEAHRARPFNIDVEVIEWNQGEIKDFVYNGQYFLGVSESEIYLPSPDTTTSVIITTDYPGGWTPDFRSDENNWLTYSSGTCTGEMKKDELFFNLSENTGDTIRIGYIYLKAGVLKHKITVYQDIDGEDLSDVIWEEAKEANCYLLHPKADGIIFPVSQANADGVKMRIGPNDELTADVLWTDKDIAVGQPGAVIRSVKIEGTGSSAKMKVAANHVSGNAVVAVRNQQGTIRWSWHIWVQEYNPEDNIKEFKGVKFMDRNLGAVSAEKGHDSSLGLVYQWGRKDPFPGAEGFNPSKEKKIYDIKGDLASINIDDINLSNETMLEEAIENPMVYYKGGSATNDWYTNTTSKQNNYLWRTSSGESTVYDPCPYGWTVIYDRAIWYDYNDTNLTYASSIYGLYSDSMGYWPFGGYRDNDGIFNVSTVGSEGYFWTGEFNGDGGVTINLKNGWPDPGKNRHPCWGHEIRCVKK